MEYPTIVRAQDLENLGLADTLVVLGLKNWPARMVVGSAVAGAISYCIKRPRCCFSADGSIKPFRPLSADPLEENSTYLHFMLVPLLGGFVLGHMV